MRFVFALLLLSSMCAAQAGRSGSPTMPRTDDIDSTASTGASQSNVVYGIAGKEKLKLDVYSPKPAPTAPVPGIILIHGGAWREGDKAMLSNLARFFAKEGYVAFSINYRLNYGKKDRWPAQLDDAQRAVRWVRANAAQYHVDPNRIGAWGHSAGAQMAALLGEVDTRDNSDAALAQYSSRVQAVVDVSGPVDFLAYKDPDSVEAFSELMGMTPQQNQQAWKDASPVYDISKATVPFLIIHGTQDNLVPIAQAVEFANALRHAGIDATLLQWDDGHNMEDHRKQLAVESASFFDRTLKSPAPKTETPTK